MLIFTVVVSASDTTTAVSMEQFPIDTTTSADSAALWQPKVLTTQQKRYKVVTAVAMMLFVGLAMGTASGNNPK